MSSENFMLYGMTYAYGLRPVELKRKSLSFELFKDADGGLEWTTIYYILPTTGQR